MMIKPVRTAAAASGPAICIQKDEMTGFSMRSGGGQNHSGFADFFLQCQRPGQAMIDRASLLV